MKTFFNIGFLFFIVSCSTHLTISSRNCLLSKRSPAMVGASDNIIYESSYWFMDIGANKRVVLLKDILEKSGIACESVRNLNYEIKQGPLEVALSLLPLIHREKIIIRGDI